MVVKSKKKKKREEKATDKSKVGNSHAKLKAEGGRE